MTEPTPEPADDAVPFVRVRCDACRRARSRYLASLHKGGAGTPRLGGFVPVCPHYTTVWAPGQGPESGSHPRPGTPEDRRRGPA